MSPVKNCFFDKGRPCDLTCKAAFEVDDPVDNVDCYFVWLAYHLGEGLFDFKKMMDGFGGGFGTPPGTPGSGPFGGPSSGPPHPGGSPGPKPFPKN